MKLIVAATFILFLLFPVKKTVRFDAVLHSKNCTEVFHFVSSVENFQTLNPTILSINNWVQVNDSSFYLEYSEYLTQVPSIRNYARAFYRIQEESNAPERRLVSQHETCFLTDFSCLTTDSVLTISERSANEVNYREEITFTCPWILSWFCYLEVETQRNMIISQLGKIFSPGKKIHDDDDDGNEEDDDGVITNYQIPS